MGLFSLVGDVLTLPTFITNIVNKIWPDQNEKISAEVALSRLLAQTQTVGLEVQKIEAQSRSRYVMYARPTLLYSVVVYTGVLLGYFIVHHSMQWGTDILHLYIEFVAGIFGVGYTIARTLEKFGGKAR